MDRRALLLAPLLLHPAFAWAAGPTPVVLSEQDRADIARIEAYLNSVRSLHSRFFQVSPNGATAGGEAWLVRPGRMRFQYDPPVPYLLVAGHGLLVFHDSQLKQTTNIPLGETPLGILLQDNLKLAGDVTIVSFVRQPGQLQVGLVRTRSPQDGVLTLIFADNPLTLRQWIVQDAQRQETRVTLTDIQLGGSYPDKMFEFIDPKFFQNNQGG